MKNIKLPMCVYNELSLADEDRLIYASFESLLTE